MLFDQIIGQKKVIQQLKTAVENDRVPQAMLFLGPEGNGALPIAIAFAEYLEAFPNTDQPDSKFARLIHPDLHMSFPVTKRKSNSPAFSNDWISEFRKTYEENPHLTYVEWMRSIADNKQGNISAEECREIIRRSNLKSFQAKYKVQIIWCAERLGKEGNILLKSLEEPPPNTIFILIATNQEQILSTILSRTQIVRVGSVDDESIEKGLMREFQLEMDDARRIALIADGNYNYAKQLAQKEAIPLEDLWKQWLTACFIHGQKNQLDSLQKTFDSISMVEKLGREEIKAFLQYGLQFLHGVLTISNGLEARLPGAQIDYAQNLLKVLTFDDIYAISNLVSEMTYMIERNVNPRLVLLDASMHLADIARKKVVVAR